MQRKTVTVLFCDITGSTALGESTDPEALRGLLARYFERMKGIVEFHGGTVEKFIGDAVMAVFGVPQVHEDDALRACRAAVEMRAALPELGLDARIGLNTGEVVTGTEERLATGDAVNVAARLEQAAQPGEILLGEATLALVSDAAETEAVEPLELKGKAEPVPAHRLLSVRDAPERSHETLFVGRSRELDALGRAWGRVMADERCELATVAADAGVGKSRLIAELLSSIDAPVVRGRCLPYGEGITYWPVVEVLRQLASLPSDPAAAASLRSLLGENQASTSAEEIAWAFRKLLEERAPIVVVFDDIQWGEERFLDLVEHVALLSSAPILVLCMARPELLDRRPTWPVLLRLEPLDDAEVEQLMPDRMPTELRERIAHAAGGNPLFIAEMLAMTNGANGELAVPPTLQALLAARLDQLEAAERRVLECAAVEGEVFHRGAVQALAPQETQVTARLASLVRREVVRPDRSTLPDEDGFRFRHLLIRDAAYEALPKAVRAELHERFAAWLERHREAVELDEILGHHLELAARYKAELAEPDLALGERAAAHLATAGRRALWRADESAAARLLERSVELIRPGRSDVDLELDFATCFFDTDPRRCTEIAEAAAKRAGEEGDARGEAVARVAAETSRMIYDPDPDELGRRIESALDLLADDDHTGLAIVWLGAGWRANFLGSGERWAEAAERATHHSRAAGQRFNDIFGLEGGLFHGPRPADAALRTLDMALPENPHPISLLARAQFLAMLGRLEQARRLAEDVAARLIDMEGLDTGRRKSDPSMASIAEYEGDYDLAIEHTSRQVEWLETSGQFSFLSTQAAMLARWLCLVGRYDEAAAFAQRAREVADADDASAQKGWRQAQALVHAQRGEHGEAERLAREAVQVAERTDFLDGQAEAYADLAEVLAAAERTDDAAASLEEALDRFERKEDVVMAGRVRLKLESLRGRSRT